MWFWFDVFYRIPKPLRSHFELRVLLTLIQTVKIILTSYIIYDLASILSWWFFDCIEITNLHGLKSGCTYVIHHNHGNIYINEIGCSFCKCLKTTKVNTYNIYILIINYWMIQNGLNLNCEMLFKSPKRSFKFQNKPNLFGV